MTSNATIGNTTAAVAAAATATAETTRFPASFTTDEDPDPELQPYFAHYDAFESTFVQQIIFTKTIALLSVMGSTYILYKLVIAVKDAEHRKKKLDRTFDRLLLGLCVSDLISSSSLFFSSWAIPAVPPMNAYDVSVYWNLMYPQAVGNTSTCTAQGFFLYIGAIASALLTGSISISFLLQVKFHLPEHRMRVAEKIFFGVSAAFPLLASIFILLDEGFNTIPAGFCWIGTDPWACTSWSVGKYESSVFENDEILEYCADNANQIRGKNYMLYNLVFVAMPLAVTLLAIMICTGTVVWSVRTQEMRAKRWSNGEAIERDRKRVFVKSALYIGAFLVVWVPCLLSAFINFGSTHEYVIVCFFAPLQGVLNVLIYSDLFSVFKVATASAAQNVRRSMSLTCIEPSVLCKLRIRGEGDGDDPIGEDTEELEQQSNAISAREESHK